MIRIAAAFCFSLTMLCPVFCLSEVDGCCADYEQSGDGNCEAMSVGAVVGKSDDSSAFFHPLPLAFDRLFPAEAFRVGSYRRLQLADWNRENVKPPPAAIRQSLLQSFLF